jgi:CHAT domain-containing protein
LLPLHAARYLEGERQRSLIDEFEIVYTPSARALSDVRRAAKQRQAGSHLAGIGNPLPNKQTLAALHEQLLAAVQELADDGQIAGVRSDLEQLLLEYSTEDLVGDGARLRELARQLPTEGGAQVRDLARRWPVPLRFAVDEVHCIESVWPADTADLLTEQAATREALELLFPAATLIHLACHGEFQPAAPLTSGLKLAGEDRLTLNDLLGQTTNRLANTRLVVLSACQTAITDTRTLPEEAIGLPAGFMQAGVPAVIGTLWSVDDASTALLMARFYELTVLQELRPASALREAQRWLRDLSTAQLKEYLAQHTSKPGTVSAAKPLISPVLELGLSELLNRVGPREQPFDNPYFWAPFTFHGAYEAAI